MNQPSIFSIARSSTDSLRWLARLGLVLIVLAVIQVVATVGILLSL